MGQDTSKFGFPSTALEPGTYRIVNASSGTLLESPDYDRQKVIGGSPRPDSKHQQVRTFRAFKVQRSPRIYPFLVVCAKSGERVSVQELPYRDILDRPEYRH